MGKKNSITHVILTGVLEVVCVVVNEKKVNPKQYLEIFDGKSLFEMTATARNIYKVMCGCYR
jgi:mannose-1-phosphate guanylyltransferase